MNFWKRRRILAHAKQEIINALLVDELLELWDICGVKYEYVESDYTADWINLYDNKISYFYYKKCKNSILEKPKAGDKVGRNIIYQTRSKRLRPHYFLRHTIEGTWKPNEWYGYRSMRRRIKFLIKVTKKIYKSEILQFHKNGYYLSPLIEIILRDTNPPFFFALLAPDGEPVFPIQLDGSDGIWKWSNRKANKEKDKIVWQKEKNGWAAYYRVYKKSLP
ncbi:MAG: hypothetical protein JEZ09_15420 [Salinivirgaceae bacterium]|nr:hypothetical protein [Salinivirgaceae bacterium]